jgi:hypothetical protein
MKAEWGEKSIDRAAYFWLRNLSFGFAAEEYLGPENIIRVRYEDLVLHTEETLKKVSKFIGIDYQAQMITGDKKAVPGFTRDQHQLVGQNPVPERVIAWETELTSREIEIFEDITGDMLAYLGYKRKFPSQKRPMRTGERIQSHMHNYRKIALNLWHNFRKRKYSG